MTKWSSAMAKDWQPEPKLDAAQTKRATDMGMRMGMCMQHAMSAPAVDQEAR